MNAAGSVPAGEFAAFDRAVYDHADRVDAVRYPRQSIGYHWRVQQRRLLGILRDPHEETGLTPQPGIGDLAALADLVREGLRILLDMEQDLSVTGEAANGRLGLAQARNKIICSLYESSLA